MSTQARNHDPEPGETEKTYGSGTRWLVFKVPGHEREKWEVSDTIACCSLKLAQVIARRAIAKEHNGASWMACGRNPECHRDTPSDSSEPAIPDHSIGYISQAQPDPLAKFASIEDDDILRLKQPPQQSRDRERMYSRMRRV